MRILFVCMGNICRSPTAEGVLRARALEAGLTDLEIDSAGTGSWHIGKAPDVRARHAAAKRHYEIGGLRGRQVSAADFRIFDLILAMDLDNLADLKKLRPRGANARLQLLLDYAPDIGTREVPDPYSGEEDGFERVLDMIELACDGLLEDIQGAKQGPGQR